MSTDILTQTIVFLFTLFIFLKIIETILPIKDRVKRNILVVFAIIYALMGSFSTIILPVLLQHFKTWFNLIFALNTSAVFVASLITYYLIVEFSISYKLPRMFTLLSSIIITTMAIIVMRLLFTKEFFTITLHAMHSGVSYKIFLVTHILLQLLMIITTNICTRKVSKGFEPNNSNGVMISYIRSITFVLLLIAVLQSLVRCNVNLTYLLYVKSYLTRFILISIVIFNATFTRIVATPKHTRKTIAIMIISSTIILLGLSVGSNFMININKTLNHLKYSIKVNYICRLIITILYMSLTLLKIKIYQEANNSVILKVLHLIRNLYYLFYIVYTLVINTKLLYQPNIILETVFTIFIITSIIEYTYKYFGWRSESICLRNQK